MLVIDAASNRADVSLINMPPCCRVSHGRLSLCMALFWSHSIAFSLTWSPSMVLFNSCVTDELNACLPWKECPRVTPSHSFLML